MTKKKILVGSLVVVVVGVLVYFNFAGNGTKATQVATEIAAVGELVEVVSASGRIQPQTKVDITSEINGEIIDLRVKEGQYVTAGDLLVVLDTVQLRSDVDQARFAVNEIEAHLSGSKVALDQAKEEFERQKRLFSANLTSETQYKNAEYAYLSAQSTWEASKAQAKQAQFRYEKQLDYLSKAKIIAPMPGIITYLDCEIGEIAAAQTGYTQGKTLMTISNLEIFEVEVEVDETEINKIDLNQQAAIEVDAFPDTTFAGKVVEIGNTAVLSASGTSDQSTDFNVKVVFEDPNVKIRPGMSATVDITTNKREDALKIPYSAIVMRSYDLDSLERARSGEVSSAPQPTGELMAAEGGVEPGSDSTADTSKKVEKAERKDVKGVFVITEGKARFTPIETGIADQKNIEIISGLVQGDSVVSGPYRVLRTIKDGDQVELEKKPENEKE